MKIIVEQATRRQKKLRLGLTGVYGSGKTWSALAIAHGLLHQLPVDERAKKILVFDTEAGRASMKAGRFKFDVFNFLESEQGRPVHALDYVEMIKYADDKGYEVLILDSITPHWESVNAEHSRMSGNSYANWGKVKDKYLYPFVNALLGAKCHVIVTVRAKVVNALNEKGQRNTVGLDIKQQDELPYFLDFFLALDTENSATVEKQEQNSDGSPVLPVMSFKPSENTGITLAHWLESAEETEDLETKTVRFKVVDVMQQYLAAAPDDTSYAGVELQQLDLAQLKELGKQVSAKLKALKG